ncbi:MAG: CPBP family intramembrane metalloprotease [Planctomycetes bacterium]|nr:CPBP family intramembrane metalloprotease [Planctomycetota bacterium]MCB9917931.1 CPBP family intramembrane metalloprotease [Planctomycetota bacterium]
MMICSRCGAKRAPTANYCPSCGTPTLAHKRQHRERTNADRSRRRTAVLALAVTVIGPLVVGVLAYRGMEDAAEWIQDLANFSVSVASAWFAYHLLRRHRTQDAMGAGLHGRTMLEGAWVYPVAILTGFSTWSIAWLYVEFGYRAFVTTAIEETAALPPSTTAWDIAAIVVIAPIVEEALCRGAAWEALKRLADGRTTVLGTAAIFAILHGMNGGVSLELPHRFVGGVAFGCLRLASGSVRPSIVAHAVHNALALVV